MGDPLDAAQAMMKGCPPPDGELPTISPAVQRINLAAAEAQCELMKIAKEHGLDDDALYYEFVAQMLYLLSIQMTRHLSGERIRREKMNA